jgi:3-methyladenine DNA glycosylase AlkC
MATIKINSKIKESLSKVEKLKELFVEWEKIGNEINSLVKEINETDFSFKIEITNQESTVIPHH